jgi:DNA-binding FadR family transcriptional regulator
MAALAENQRAISDRARYLQTDIAFHRTIATMTGNAIFEAAAGVILEWLARFRVDCVHVEGANLLSYDEHAGIARAIAAGDPDAAAEAMTRHQQRSHALYRLLGAGAGDAGRSGPGPAARAWPKAG